MSETQNVNADENEPQSGRMKRTTRRVGETGAANDNEKLSLRDVHDPYVNTHHASALA